MFFFCLPTDVFVLCFEFRRTVVMCCELADNVRNCRCTPAGDGAKSNRMPNGKCALNSALSYSCATAVRQVEPIRFAVADGE